MLLALLLFPSPAPAQQPDSTDQASETNAETTEHWIRCAAMIPQQARAALDRGTPPALVVADTVRSRLEPPTHACPPPRELATRIQQLRFIKPPAAVELYGRTARHGAVVVTPAPRSPANSPAVAPPSR